MVAGPLLVHRMSFASIDGPFDPAAAKHKVVLIKSDDLARRDGFHRNLEGDGDSASIQRPRYGANRLVPRANLHQTLDRTFRDSSLPVESLGAEPAFGKGFTASQGDRFRERLDLDHISRCADRDPPAPAAGRS